jgi:hypothetical protein
MKRDIDIAVTRKESDKSLAKRREDYALKRDAQALEFNETITKRRLREESAKADEDKSTIDILSDDSPSIPEGE